MNTLQLVESIFFGALDKESPEARAAFLDEACRGDASVRSCVEKLLSAHGKAEGFLKTPVFGSAQTVDQSPLEERPGTVIGPYKILETLGEGGFGVVFLAEQAEPVRRKVALKIIKPGMDSKQVVARFEAERQALALMDHPNIARVLDGGTTASGRPYFVMELVKGIPITEFCDQNRLTPRERLQLLVPVCQAVQHAHQKGIIHRDLKPSNILVTLYDDRPVPKVIDFGVAKAIHQPLTEQTLYTRVGQIIGTLEYMSPEQASMNALDVDTRSDIYALGVLLYELLTGSTPLKKEQIEGAAFMEILRLVRETDPPRPSTRLSQLGGGLPMMAAYRKTDAKRLYRLVRGDLDWIVMKCLEKDRNRRYETANGLARDLERYLGDEPVQARPPSAFYRFAKYARRHRQGLATALLLAIVLLVAVGTVAASLGWASRDRQARQYAVNQAVANALEQADQFLKQGKWQDAEVAAHRAHALLANGEGSPEFTPRVDQMLADLHMIQRLDEIRTQYMDRFDDNATDFAYAKAFADYGIDMEALEPADAAVRIREHTVIAAILTGGVDDWMRVRRNRHNVQHDDPALWKRLLEVAQLADSDSWRKQVRQLISVNNVKALRQVADKADVGSLSVNSILLMDNALVFVGETKACVTWLRQAQCVHPGDFWINFGLAFRLGSIEPISWEEILRYQQAALAARPQSIVMYFTVGTALIKLGRHNEAIATYRQAVKIDPHNSVAYWELGKELQYVGEFDEASAAFRVASKLQPNTAGQCNLLAWWLVTCPDPKLRDAKRAVALAKKAVAEKPLSSGYWNTLGVAEYRAGNWKAALAALEEAIKLRPPGTSFDYFFMAMAYWQLENKERALEYFDKAIKWMGPASTDHDLLAFRAEAEALLGINGPEKLGSDGG